MAGVAEQLVAPSGQASEIVHCLLDDSRKLLVERIDGLTRLEERIRVVRGTSHHRVLRRKRPRTERAHQIVVDHRPDLLVGNDRDLVLFVRCTKAVEEIHDRHTRFQGRRLRDQREIVRLLHRGCGEHGKAGHARAHHVRVIAEDRQRLRRERTCRNVKHARRQFAGDLVHVGQHQQQALRRGVSRCEGTALQRAVHRTGSTALGLHLLHYRDVAPDVLDALRGPGVGQLGHRRRWGDRKDRRDFVDAVRDVGGRCVAIHDGRLNARHACSPGRMSGTDLELRRHRWFSRTGRRSCRDGRLRAHLDCMAGALLITHGTARAQIVVVAVETAFAELDDRLLRTGRVTVVAFEAVAAGKAATGLITRLGLGEACDHLFESLALLDREFRPAAAARRRGTPAG